MKIAITGATGQLGQLVIESLLKQTDAKNIVALVRDLDKASVLKQQGIETRLFNYDQPEILVPALVGIEKLLLISANEVGRRTPQHRAVIEAAKVTAIQHIVYTSLLRADQSPLGLAQEHRETESLIKNSSLSYTILRNNWYSENYLAGLAHNIESGLLFGAAQDGKISSASRQDYAEAAAAVLLGTGHENKTYELAGSTSFTQRDLAQFISEASGKSVHFQNLSAEEYTQGLIQAGLPEGLVQVIVDADVHTRDGAMFSESKDLETLLGRKTTPILDTIKSLL
ncbi:SDR family oxidoreductase [Acinetobacter sp. 187]|uniref:SDR family oxidoreductase n=1 Tax=Acinetobacter lanii TaxID=2715163 RepID=UPI001407CBA0|nr:SDR family oxidoreductase [Acinetobacter lanii]NHC04771.1 SDR family oxidoreductase [Acinetobacter lanii]